MNSRVRESWPGTDQQPRVDKIDVGTVYAGVLCPGAVDQQRKGKGTLTSKVFLEDRLTPYHSRGHQGSHPH